MLTLSHARLRLRRWLEDEAQPPSASPLWSDEQLDEGLSIGLAEVSEVAPWIVSDERVVSPSESGATSMPAPDPYQRLRRLFDPSGIVVPYDVVADQIRPAYGGTFDPGIYLLTYQLALTMPASDTAAIPCPLRLEPLLLAAAAYWCLSQRATSQAKRGGITSSEQARLDATRQDLETLRKQARRTVNYQTLVA